MRRRDDRGAAGSVLVAGLCLVLVSTFMAAAVLIQWLFIARRAEHSAELAALAAVSAAVSGQLPCRAAEEAAARNEADLAVCHVRGEGRSIVVEIGIRAGLAPPLPGMPGELVRFATAGT
ncbi:MAG TPA: Rv3654c family TadE-like protein [Arachnia sp.]|nr:Rv3654c family TadE-like protein [Arachnia sp.]